METKKRFFDPKARKFINTFPHPPKFICRVVVAYLNHMAFEKTGIFGEYGNLKLSPFLALLTVFGLFTLLRMFYKLTSKPSNPVKS